MKDPLIHGCCETLSPRVITNSLSYSNTSPFLPSPCLTLLFPKSHTSASPLIYALAAFHHRVSTLCRSPEVLTVQCSSVQCGGHSQGKERMAPCCSTCKKLKNILSKFGFRSRSTEEIEGGNCST